MIIDHQVNPLGIVKRFRIPYGGERGLHLEGQVIAITEEGHTEANWFEFRVIYPRLNNSEIGGNLNNYRQERRGTPTLEGTERKLKDWIKGAGFRYGTIRFSNS